MSGVAVHLEKVAVLTEGFVATLWNKRIVPIQGPTRGAPWSMVLTKDEKTLIVAADRYVAFLDVDRLTNGQGDPVLGYLQDRRLGGTNGLNVTADGRYLFVANAWTASTVVIDVDKASSSFARCGFKGRH